MEPLDSTRFAASPSEESEFGRYCKSFWKKTAHNDGRCSGGLNCGMMSNTTRCTGGMCPCKIYVFNNKQNICFLSSLFCRYFYRLRISYNITVMASTCMIIFF